MKVVAIIQARMGSTRLPGKVLKRIAGKTVIEHVIERVSIVQQINEIIVATTNKLDDNKIVQECNRLNIKNYRGSETDVLSRYYYAAKDNDAEIIVRITSDCPLIVPEVVERIIKTFTTHPYDYLSNTLSRTFPRGLDCEVFHFNVLQRCFNEATKLHQREHVTPYIYENQNSFLISQLLDIEDNSRFRCTLDTEDDFRLISAIFNINDNLIRYDQLLTILKENPEIVKLNAHICQKDMNYEQ